VVAPVLVLAVKAPEEAVEFVGEEVERLVGIIAGDAGELVGAADLEVAFGR